jgi:cholesterol transport system auxiliary component
MRFVRFLPLLLAAGCTSSGGQDSILRTYDLGTVAPKAQLPALRSVTVRAPMPYDGTDMLYRLAWKDGAEIAPFAQTRWAAPPAELVRRQLVRALPASASAPCALEVELQDFSQVFSAKEASEARVELRASLIAGNARVAAKGFGIAEGNAGGSAATGASAFARAADRAVGELASWIAAQPGCR